MGNKAKDAFRTIGEVADWLDVPAHVLRFWESKFQQIKPVKRSGGRRYYRPADMKLIGGIKALLHDQGVTIRGVQMKLKEDGIEAISALSPSINVAAETPKSATISATAEPDEKIAPFIEVPEDTTVGGDNVVSLSRREQRRADLEIEADKLEPAENDAPAEDYVPTHDDVGTGPEPTPEPASNPEPLVDTTPAAEEPVTDPTPEPEEIAAELVPKPDLTQISVPATRASSLATIAKLRRSDPACLENSDEIRFLEHRARALRTKMAASL